MPAKDDEFEIPDSKQLKGVTKTNLTPSPKIESRDPKIIALAKEIGVDKKKAWDHVEAIYDWVRTHVKYQLQSGEHKDALATLKDGTGDCEEFTSLFVADLPGRRHSRPQRLGTRA